MEETITTIAVILSIVQIIVLITFFTISSNIAKIKQNITPTKPGKRYMEMSFEEKYIGNIEKEKECLLRARYYFKERKEVFYDDYTNKEAIAYIDKRLSELYNKN